MPATSVSLRNSFSNSFSTSLSTSFSNSFSTCLSLVLCTSLAAAPLAQAAPPPPPPPPSGSATATADQPPDPNAVSAEERLKWAKKLFTEARAAHDAEDYYNSVIKFEQAYNFAPDKHIFAFNIGQDSWELKDCVRVKQYLELFLIKETANQELRTKAQNLLAKAENNKDCLTGGPAPTTTSTGGGGGGGSSSRPADDTEDPLALRKRGGDEGDDEGPKKRGASGLLIGGVVLTVLGLGAAGGGIGTMLAAKGKKGDIEGAARSDGPTTFPQGTYNSNVDGDIKSLKTLNTVTPLLLGIGGALFVGGIVMIIIDRGNKKKSKGFYARKPGHGVELVGVSAAPLPGGGAAGSFALRF